MTTWIQSNERSLHGVTVAKMRITAELPAGPGELGVHPGRYWFTVLDGTARLQLGERTILVQAGDAADFSTMVPPAITAHDGPVEILTILSHDGERAHLYGPPRHARALRVDPLHRRRAPQPGNLRPMPAPAEPFVLVVDGTQTSAIHSGPDRPSATVVIAHGAGAGMEHRFIAGFADALNAGGVATLRFNFPYIDAGKTFPDRPPVAIATWRAALAAATERGGGAPVWAAGKSFGGRMASMAVAQGMEAAGLIFLGYPLHAPGKPEKPRDAHLYALELPLLFLQGTRDPFALPGELEPVLERISHGPPGNQSPGRTCSRTCLRRILPSSERGSSSTATIRFGTL